MATTLTEGVELINSTLTKLGYDFQIDTTSDTTMTTGLQTIGAFPPSQLNPIMEQMNLILQERNYGVMFDASKNPFRNFLVDMSMNGFGIKDVYHELISGIEPLWDSKTNGDDVAADLVSYADNTIDYNLHTKPMSREFKTTIDTRNIEKVFTPYGLPRYIDTALANLSWSAEVWLQSQAIDIVKTMISNSDIVFSTGHNVNTTDGVEEMVTSIRSTVSGFLTPTDIFNKGVKGEEGEYREVVSMSNSIDDVFIITTPELMERLYVNGYAHSYNLDDFALKGRVIYAPSGTDFGDNSGETVYFVVVDRRAIVLGLRRWLASSFFIPNVHRVNHWLNVEGIKDYNTVFNAVAFTAVEYDGEIKKKMKLR